MSATAGCRSARRARRLARAASASCAALLLASPFIARSDASIDLLDDAGHRWRAAEPARRVITLAPNLTEIVYAVGGGATLVGTIDASDFPALARSLPHVGNHQRLDIERIVALKPTLVLAWGSGNAARDLAQLESLGIAVFRLEPRRLDDVPQAMERVGAILGRREAGSAAAARLRARLQTLRTAHAGAAPLRVFYQVWPQPLMTLNDRHLVGDAIAACGGRNVFGTLPALAPTVSVEAVLAADPQVMFSGEPGVTGDAPRRAPRSAAFEAWQRFGRLTAVRQGWLYELPAAEITRAGPRIAEGVQALCAALDEARREGAAAPQGR